LKNSVSLLCELTEALVGLRLYEILRIISGISDLVILNKLADSSQAFRRLANDKIIHMKSIENSLSYSSLLQGWVSKIKHIIKTNKKIVWLLFFLRWLKNSKNIFFVWISSVLLQATGTPKISCPQEWIGLRRLVLKMLGADYTSTINISWPQNIRDLNKVKDNVIKTYYSNSAEGPVTVVRNPFNSFDTHTYFWTPRRNYELANIVFYSKSGLVLINGMVISESSHYYPQPSQLWVKNLAWQCRKIKLYNNGPCAGIGFAYNYHHWLTEDLTSVLRILRQFGTDISFITPTTLARFQVDALDLLRVKRIEIDEPVFCSRFYLAGQHQRSEAALRPSELEYLRQAFLNLPSIVDSEIKNKTFDVYISRSKTSRVDRLLLQEKQLEQLLRNRGFIVVCTEDMSFADEIKLFHQAKSIVGIIGSGLANHFWMPPGGRVIIIHLDDFFDPSLDYTAPMLGLQISHIDCREKSVNTPAHYIMQKISGLLSV